ncbi:MAG: FHA domain-containing protein [Deltaproteobacteria bacterium]|nr:FHA domain-containing protein [Deltaproteobacteria bacterium]
MGQKGGPKVPVFRGGIPDFENDTEVEASARERPDSETSLEGTKALDVFTLEVTGTDGARNQHRLIANEEAPLTIGRHTDNELQLLDPGVSKQHLRLTFDGSSHHLLDLGSANGTLVNGLEIRDAHLVDGDVIEIGHFRLRYCVQKTLPTLLAPPPPNEHASDGPTRRPAPSGAPASAKVAEPRRQENPLAGIPNIPDDLSTPFGAPIESGFDQEPEHREERTMVALVPNLGDLADESVVAVPMQETFAPATVLKNLDLERDYERLRVAFDLAQEVGLTKDLFRLGETILSRIGDVLFSDTAVIMLRDEEGELVPLASRVDDGREEVRIPKAIVEKVVQSREGLLTRDAQADSMLRSHTVVGQRIRSALCIPLVMEKEVYGVIHLSSSSAAGIYGERDLALLKAIAQPAALAVANVRLMQRVQEEAKNRAEFERFLSPALVERVMSNDLSLGKEGDKVTATVLFSDIRGFAAMSDGVAPEKVVSMLNEYFEAMVEVVFDYGGTLDKFLGDGLMAVWGTPFQAEDDARRAVRAAKRMRKVLHTQVNAARKSRGEVPLEIGIGIATGEVIAGAMGGRRRQDYTVIGDVVNLSSRLCSQAKSRQILVCEESAKKAQGGKVVLTELPAQKVKGVSRPVPRFEVPIIVK